MNVKHLNPKAIGHAVLGINRTVKKIRISYLKHISETIYNYCMIFESL